MPEGGLAVRRLDRHAEESPCEIEEPLQDPGQGEIGPQLLLAVGEAVLSQPLRPVGHVPKAQLAGLGGSALPGEVAQLFQVAHRRLVRGPSEILQESLDRYHVGRHLGVEAQRGVAGEAEKLRLLPAQIQHDRDRGRVVERALSRPGDVGAVEALAQIPAGAVGEEWNRAGGIESDPPGPLRGGCVRLARLPRRLGRQLQQALGKSLHLLPLAEPHRVGLGGVEHVVAEAGRQLGELGLDRVEPLAGLAFQAHPGVSGIAEQRRHDPPLGRIQRLPSFSLAKRGEPVEDGPALAHPQAEAHHLALHRLVGLAHRVAALHRQQVTGDSPGEAQSVPDPLQRLDQPLPAGLVGGLQALDLAGELGQQTANPGLHVLGPDPIEGRKTPPGEEGVLREIEIAHSAPSPDDS
jgi:hypothetical protein